MKSNLKFLALVSIAALMTAPMAMADQTNAYHVPGESIDAGISAALTPAYLLHHVPGESLDAGIAAPRDAGSVNVAGEKLDSGLGFVTEEEIRRIVNAYKPKQVASLK